MLFINLFENDLKLFLPEFFLVTAILTLVLYGSVYSVSREYNYPLINISTCWATIFTLGNTFLLVLFTREVSSVIFNGTFICDLLSQNAKLFLLGATIVCLLIDSRYACRSTATHGLLSCAADMPLVKTFEATPVPQPVQI